jgi:2-phosphoglycerate kinase
MSEVNVRKDDGLMPFSRGVLAKTILRSGLDHLRAYEIAEEVKLDLAREGLTEVTSDEVLERSKVKLRKIDPKFEHKYMLWSRIGRLRYPMFILLAGGTGVGTTTLAAELGYRLGIRRVIGTDVVREILRKAISGDFLPTLHQSSFKAGDSLDIRLLSDMDRDIIGFESQADAVCKGVEALIDRGMRESTSMIIEGVHILPSLIGPTYLGRKNVFLFALDIKGEEQHLNRFYMREKSSNRMAKPYVENFRTIRKIQGYIVNDAAKNNVEVIELDSTRNMVDRITDRILEQMADTQNEDG